MMHVLVVDDCAVDRRMVGGLLQQGTNWSISYACDGKEALSQIAQDRPDLVVTDIQMPVMDGLELVRQIRAGYSEVPVMLITSEGSEEIAMQALAAGATSYSPKRLLSADLVRTAKNLLDHSGESRRRHRMRQCVVESQFHFSLENDTSLIQPLVEHFQHQMIGWNDSERLRIGVAVDEAVVNAIYHGNLEISSELREHDDEQFYKAVRERRQTSPYDQRRVQVKIRVTSDDVHVVIRDQGPGYNPDSVPDPTHPDNLDKVSGRGLLLIRTFMDEVSFNSAGNEIRMRKRRTDSPVAM